MAASRVKEAAYQMQMLKADVNAWVRRCLWACVAKDENKRRSTKGGNTGGKMNG